MRTHRLFHFLRVSASGTGPGSLLLVAPLAAVTATATAEIQLLTPALLPSPAAHIQTQAVATLSGTTVAELPCPEFPVLRLEQRPLRRTDAAGGVVLAELAQRINHREVELRYELMSHTDRQSVLDVWQGGAGLVRPFFFTVPGEGSARRFVFGDEQLTVDRLNCGVSRARVVLRDVGRGID